MDALLFDKDGTLIDFDLTWGLWAKRYIQSLRDQSGVSVQVLAKNFELDWNHACFLPTSPIIAGTSEEIIAAVRKSCPKMSDEDIGESLHSSMNLVELVPVCELRSLFKRLSARCIIGLATNDSESSARLQLEELGIADCFNFVAGYDSGYGAKPEPGMCLEFIENFDLDPLRTVMIGDSTHDLRAGRAAKMKTLGVLTGPAKVSELEPFADGVITSIESIEDWLVSL